METEAFPLSQERLDEFFKVLSNPDAEAEYDRLFVDTTENAVALLDMVFMLQAEVERLRSRSSGD